MDCSQQGSSVHEILQARILVWIAMPSSRASSQPKDWTHDSCGSCITGALFTSELPVGSLCISFEPWSNSWTLPKSSQICVDASSNLSPDPYCRHLHPNKFMLWREAGRSPWSLGFSNSRQLSTCLLSSSLGPPAAGTHLSAVGLPLSNTPLPSGHCFTLMAWNYCSCLTLPPAFCLFRRRKTIHLSPPPLFHSGL